MEYGRNGCRVRWAISWTSRVPSATLLVRGLLAAGSTATMPAVAAQRPAAVALLVFDGVTVVDVEHGTLRQGQRVVIDGNRVQAVGDVDVVKTPKGAQVVDARGRYLIPGLWDMHTHGAWNVKHTHPDHQSDIAYPLFIANGITGIRDAGSSVPLDTLIRWRREIVAGARVGPPRQLLSGQSIGDSSVQMRAIPLFPDLAEQIAKDWKCQRSEMLHSLQNCVSDTADARRVVDSLKATGADMIKPRAVDRATYFVIASEARRLRIPFGGHVTYVEDGDSALNVTAAEASDSGAVIIDHPEHFDDCWGREVNAQRCRDLADRFRRNGTWWVPTLIAYQGHGGTYASAIYPHYTRRAAEFWNGSLPRDNWLAGSAGAAFRGTSNADSSSDSAGDMRVVERSGMPILAGSDEMTLPGFALHAELAMYVAEGMTPLAALQSATLNPAKFLKATDSLGTVAPGKLADLVLLDADPLADITNMTAIRAVVANGHYYDRVALDELLSAVQAKAKAEKATTEGTPPEP